MKKTVPYKKRFCYLVASGVLVFILAYRIAISRTITTINKLHKIESFSGQFETARLNIAGAEKQLQVINARIGEYFGDKTAFQRDLFNRTSIYCADNSLIIKDFPQVHCWKKQDYQFLTGFARLEGTFLPLLKFINNIENSHLYGRIVSLSFSANEDRKMKKTRLSLSIYIQTIKNEKP
jgi:hypothetical protein